MTLILLAHDQPMYRLIENQIGFAWTFCFSELGFGSYVIIHNLDTKKITVVQKGKNLKLHNPRCSS